MKFYIYLSGKHIIYDFGYFDYNIIISLSGRSRVWVTNIIQKCYYQVISEAFCQDEAVSIGSEVNKNPKAIEELLELCADAALDGVSVVAVAVDTGEVVSVAFNKIQVS